ncbi:MAG: penicillin acylase family protein [Sinobacteraceae bacterium]|nr:penicillin acylase family protein [Nevskiaceae bacterium]
MLARKSFIHGTLLALSCLLPPAAGAAPGGAAEWRAQATRVTITRDDWGIAHVHGHSDADAIFGMMYAQAEDDFSRVENNYLASLGRQSEAEGPGALWRDLRQQLFVDPQQLQSEYTRCPAWLRQLLQAWAAGLNYFLATHPEVHPQVLTRFEPWMALSFSEGSIGGDIERASLPALQEFYDAPQPRSTPAAAASAELAGGPAPAPGVRQRLPQLTASGLREPTGSNGFAIGPARTRDHHALLLINPHTTFYFRTELGVRSDAGLNVYGAATWGQFFIYQGFNPHVGWMHTSSGVDNVDEFAESVTVAPDGSRRYRYGTELRPVTSRIVQLSYRMADGSLGSRTFTTFATHHGPIVRAEDGRWIALALMNRPVAALQQSYLRTRATDYASYDRVLRFQANSSNNTIFADDRGEIAYLHPQFVPRRDARFDYTRPVDGSDPHTDWQGEHSLDSLPRVLNPANGWVMNTNNWPWTAAGADSPRAADFPRYMDQNGENPRGLHAQRVLNASRDFTPGTLIAAAFDPYLTAFARWIPVLLHAYDVLPGGAAARTQLAGPIEMLRHWDFRWGLQSAPTSLAVFWGEALWDALADEAQRAGVSVWDYAVLNATDGQRLAALAEAVQRLTRDFGSWQVPWGEINRLQRRDDAIEQTFSDTSPSFPVPFTSSRWGSLASFGARAYPGTRCYYGSSGNSFVAVVEFGPRVRAWAVSTGGASGHVESRHFFDQAQRYADGRLRRVYFYPDELRGHIERQYHPGN